MIKKVNLIFISLLILYSLYCAMQLGYTWDTLFHYELGKDRLNYLFSLGSNEVNENITVRKFYTGAYSTISAFFVQFFPKKYILQSIYIFNLTFSVLAIFGIYKVTKFFFNKEIAKITFVFCFFNPIFFGHMSINSNDTIITFANIWILYTVLKYFKFQENKEKRNKLVIITGLLMGLGLGVRYTFFVTLIPILFLVLVEIFYFKIFTNKKFVKKIFFLDSIKVLFIAYFFMVFFWPQTHSNIFLLPIKIAIEGLSFGFGVPFILFNQEIFITSQLPKNYILVNLLYKMPEFLIISFIIFILFFYKIKSYFEKDIKNFNFKIFLIFLIILFPNFILLISPWGIYDGFRLFLYLIPYICIIPGILNYYLFKMFKYNINKLIFIFIFVLQMFFLYNFFSLTPYHYVYLNRFAGEYNKNYEKFENDYWGISTKKLISSISEKQEIFGEKKIKIATCGLEPNAQSFYFKKLNKLKFEIVSKEEEFDYIIMNNRAFWDEENKTYDPNKAQTCFQKYTGKDLIEIKRRGLVISKITQL